MHDLISRTKFSRFHGTQLPVDFGEMPSTLLENWCWDREILKHLSRHYTLLSKQYLSEWHEKYPESPDPPAQIPDDLLETIVKSRNTHRGLRLLHILWVSCSFIHCNYFKYISLILQGCFIFWSQNPRSSNARRDRTSQLGQALVWPTRRDWRLRYDTFTGRWPWTSDIRPPLERIWYGILWLSKVGFLLSSILDESL